MNRRLVMWGTFLTVFFVSIIGSYKFVNQNNHDMTIELSEFHTSCIIICSHD